MVDRTVDIAVIVTDKARSALNMEHHLKGYKIVVRHSSRLLLSASNEVSHLCIPVIIDSQITVRASR